MGGDHGGHSCFRWVHVPLSSHSAARSGRDALRSEASRHCQRQALREQPRQDLETLRINRCASPQSQAGTSVTAMARPRGAGSGACSGHRRCHGARSEPPIGTRGGRRSTRLRGECSVSTSFAVVVGFGVGATTTTGRSADQFGAGRQDGDGAVRPPDGFEHQVVIGSEHGGWAGCFGEGRSYPHQAPLQVGGAVAPVDSGHTYDQAGAGELPQQCCQALEVVGVVGQSPLDGGVEVLDGFLDGGAPVAASFTGRRTRGKLPRPPGPCRCLVNGSSRRRTRYGAAERHPAPSFGFALGVN
jgi:hypothetical protein